MNGAWDLSLISGNSYLGLGFSTLHGYLCVGFRLRVHYLGYALNINTNFLTVLSTQKGGIHDLLKNNMALIKRI